MLYGLDIPDQSIQTWIGFQFDDSNFSSYLLVKTNSRMWIQNGKRTKYLESLSIWRKALDNFNALLYRNGECPPCFISQGFPHPTETRPVHALVRSNGFLDPGSVLKMNAFILIQSMVFLEITFRGMKQCSCVPNINLSCSIPTS